MDDKPIEIPADPSALLTTKQAAAFLNFTPRALESWRIHGGGPHFVRVSARAVRYRRRDLEDWIATKVIASTSAA